MSEREIQETIELLQRHAARNAEPLPTTTMTYEDYTKLIDDDSSSQQIRIVNNEPQLFINDKWHKIKIV
jgi:hypothetical protein